MKSSHKSEFLTLLEAAVTLREGNKTITQADFVKYLSSRNTPLAPDLQSAIGRKAKPGSLRQNNVAGTGHQRISKSLARNPGHTLNTNKHAWDLAGYLTYNDGVQTPGWPTGF